ncbi:MAG TPA: hypothetical protein VG890_13100, partial [Puia sp.]|nr:hypothetical protein [Puia sp.]
MKRRNFLQQGLGTLAMAAPIVLPAGMDEKIKYAGTGNSGQPFKLNYAIHDGMFKNSAGSDFGDQIRYAYDLGFRAIEDNGMMDRQPAEQEKIGNLLAKLNMSMGVFVHGFDHWPVST